MSWLDRFRSPETLRQRALSGLPAGVMRDFLSAPLIDPATPVNQVPLVSLDLETTGLDHRKDKIVSLGLVELEGGRINLGSAWHQLIRIDGDLPKESVVIHRITDDYLQQGMTIEEVLPRLLQRIRGKVMLVHYRPVERNFLDAACRRLYDAPFMMQTIDTLPLGQRVLERRNHTIGVNDLRLFNLRPRFNLPHYRAHNALTDALSTAELFLALVSEIAPRNNALLRDVLVR